MEPSHQDERIGRRPIRRDLFCYTSHDDLGVGAMVETHPTGNLDGHCVLRGLHARTHPSCLQSRQFYMSGLLLGAFLATTRWCLESFN